MRRKRTECRIGGCGIPVFPDGIDTLQDLYERLQLKQEVLSGIARGITGFWYSGTMPSTLDGTDWHCSLVFRFGEDGVLHVLFPLTSDEASIAFYDRGTLPEGARERVLERLLTACKALQPA